MFLPLAAHSGAAAWGGGEEVCSVWRLLALLTVILAELFVVVVAPPLGTLAGRSEEHRVDSTEVDVPEGRTEETTCGRKITRRPRDGQINEGDSAMRRKIVLDLSERQ